MTFRSLWKWNNPNYGDLLTTVANYLVIGMIFEVCCVTLALQCLLVALNHVVFDPPIQRSNPWCSSWDFCTYSWTQGRKYWKKSTHTILCTLHLFFWYIKANDSNSYTWCCPEEKKDLHCLCSISTTMETQTWRIRMSVRMCYWKRSDVSPLVFTFHWH